MQCVKFSYVYVDKKPSYVEYWDMDTILENGDAIYKSLKIDVYVS